jgi:hypothetical protein
MKHITTLTAIALAACSAAGDDFCVNPNASIPDNDTQGVNIPIVLDLGSAEVIDSIEVGLSIAHPWIGDLVITLSSPSGSTITLFEQPGIGSTAFPGPFGCGGRDIDATFSDSATQAAIDFCSYSAQPVIVGPVLPVMSLETLVGQPASGTWTLNISDRSAYDSGVVFEACLSVTTSIECLADLNADGVLNFFDVSTFLNAYNAQDPIADFTNDGVFNFFDVSAFLNAFNAGCP